MDSSRIILFDLPSRPPNKCWSLNSWKSRLLLNLKGIDYKTEWLEYPDIKPRFVEHFPKDTEAYTIPTVLLPDGKYIMDSRKIANHLEAAHPSPPLHLDSPYLTKLEAIIPGLRDALKAVFMYLLPKRLLNEASLPYWYETRSKQLSMPVDEYHAEEGGDKAWKRAREILPKVTEMLKENEGPFFLGKTASYADLVWAGYLLFWQRLGDDVFAELLKATGDAKVHEDLLDAVKPWSERADH
ncbi:uncharacterized protein BCR38DRAFT_448764 [Pseudomassariella vexata]|uniref:Uncharacterized protein n=1 Tax=Pseudomassariella vexata TaxID=1141098 RepID=A0A1Y2DGK5_9PEZI|nr:uncharacterized protein BCR38DRAFT_448764 [Pseudomassariella vexata]ORY57825.1 hypothetical protein BCR38DRAFT_448764 [Pseudomassariella vexata]